MNARITRQFPAFVVVGGVAAIANVGSRILFSRALSYAIAIVLAYVVGMIVAFVLNRLFVFRKTINPLHQQAFWFTMVNVAAVLQTLGVSLLLADVGFPEIGFQWHAETVAHAIGVMVPVVTSFIGHRKFTFRVS